MLKNKTLLYGFGAGLAIGAILVQLMNQAVQPLPKSSVVTESPNLEQMDAAKVKEVASKYYQLFPKEEKVLTQAQADALVQQKLAEEKQNLAKNTDAPVKKTYIYVASGQTSTQVAEMLYQSGLITDRKAFEDAMKQQQLTSKIMSGVHVFEGQPEMTQIISNLITR